MPKREECGRCSCCVPMIALVAPASAPNPNKVIETIHARPTSAGRSAHKAAGSCVPGVPSRIGPREGSSSTLPRGWGLLRSLFPPSWGCATSHHAPVDADCHNATAARSIRFPPGSTTAPQGEMKMMTKTLRLVAAAAALGIGTFAAVSDASAQAPSSRYLRSQEFNSRSYRPPPGQVYERGFRYAPTPDQRSRQDFQIDGSFQGS